MASTYSTSLKIQLIGSGDQSGVWGSTTNTNWNLMEQAVAGVQSITMANANYTLSNLNGVSDEARNMVLVVSGTNSAVRQIIAPLVSKFYVVTNGTSGGYAITIGGVTGSTISIPNGTTVQVYCDGTNFYSAQTASAGNFTVNGDQTIVGTLSLGGSLTATTATFSGAISSVSPNFTGVPTSPTAAPGTNTTQLATTAFVQTAATAAFPSGGIIMWSGSIASIPAGWYLCNGANGTPDLRDRFVVGAGSSYAVAATGGSKDAIIVSHTHTVTDPGHSHNVTAAYQPGGGDSSACGGGCNARTTNASLTTSTATTGISLSTTGSSGTNANLPPYYALAYIMKA